MTGPKPSRYLLTLDELSTLLESRGGKIAAPDKADLIALSPTRSGVPPKLVRQLLAADGVDYSPRVIAFSNLKGGIGKTTCAATTATRAAQYGFKTCILDLDSQGSASLLFDAMPAEDEPIFYDVWPKPAEYTIPSLRQITDGLYLMPSALENGLLDASLANPRHQKHAVRNVCNVLVENGFEVIIIDCPPSLGTAVISSVCAADIMVVPIGSDPFSFKGLDLTLGEVRAICDTYSIKLPELRVVFTKYDAREKMAKKALESLHQNYQEYYLPVPIRVSTEFSKALDRHETIFANRRTAREDARKALVKDDYDRYVRLLLKL